MPTTVKTFQRLCASHYGLEFVRTNSSDSKAIRQAYTALKFASLLMTSRLVANTTTPKEKQGAS